MDATNTTQATVTNPSIKGRPITTVIFGGDETSVEVYETPEDAEQAIKDWMLELVDGNEELTSLIEEEWIYVADPKVREETGCWFEINTQKIL